MPQKPSTPSLKGTIRLGAIDLSFHKAAAAVYQHVFEYLGYTLEVRFAPHEAMFSLHQNNEVDILISAWLPGSHQKYVEAYEDNVIKFPPIYEPYCVWLVPSYIPETLLSKVEDLLLPEVEKKMSKDINGINMGAGISRFSVEMIERYKLQERGFRFISNEPHVFLEKVEQQLTRLEWIVIPLWHPQYLHTMFDLRPLQESQGLLRGKDLATPLLLRTSAHKLLPKDLDILSSIRLGNQVVTLIDYKINKNHQSPQQAAKTWIEENYGSLATYVDTLASQATTFGKTI